MHDSNGINGSSVGAASMPRVACTAFCTTHAHSAAVVQVLAAAGRDTTAAL